MLCGCGHEDAGHATEDVGGRRGEDLPEEGIPWGAAEACVVVVVENAGGDGAEGRDGALDHRPSR